MPALLKEWIKELTALITAQHIASLLTALVILMVGFFVARKARSTIHGLKNIDSQKRMLLERLTHLGLVFITCALALDSLGFDLKVLLGAAGVLTVAIGFAAQTSASNLISGLFLMFERPFVVGDAIAIGDLQGEVVDVSLLSTRIRTFNNMMVRIPNETLVKSNITNISFYPIRRVNLEVGVDYSTDLDLVERVVRQALLGEPTILRKPEPTVDIKGFGASSIDLEIQAWTETTDYIRVRTRAYRSLNTAFQRNGINIPFPTRMILHKTESPTATN